MNYTYIGMNAEEFEKSFQTLEGIRDKLLDINNSSMVRIKAHGYDLKSKGPAATGLKETGDCLAEIAAATLDYMNGVLAYLEFVKEKIVEVDDKARAYFSQQ